MTRTKYANNDKNSKKNKLERYTNNESHLPLLFRIEDMNR